MVTFLQEMAANRACDFYAAISTNGTGQKRPATYEIGFLSPQKVSRAYARKRAASQ
jgi:hypothetical protein|tara:strand:- start:5253 stop:5420 length:168 start_codon:yes stop_codon:yes gene_type:complete